MIRETAVPAVRVTQPQSQQTFSFQNLAALKALLSIDFDDHDRRLSQCLEAACHAVQNRTSRLLLESTVTVSWATFYDWEDLPWGPVTGDVVASNLDGTSPVTDFFPASLSDEDYPRLRGSWPLGIRLSYQAGYNWLTLPDDLLQACLDLAANHFDQGDRDWRSTVFEYRRGSFIQ